jgi:type IV pilus assembly protein PilC
MAKKLQQKQEKQSLLELDVSLGGVSLTQKALFAKHLAVMLKAGLTITDALTTALESTEGKFKKTIHNVLRSVEAGRSLSVSFADYPHVFSGLFVNVTAAGEKSGTLVENFENIAVQLEKERELVSKVKGALLYPVIILVAASVLGMVISFVVLPKIIPLFEGLKVELPLTTRILISFSHLVQEKGVFLFLGIVGFVAGFLWTIRQAFSRPVTNWFMLHTPVLKNIIKSANLARFSRTLAMLLKSGVTIDEALGITQNTVGNYYYQEALKKVSNNITSGTKLSSNLEEFPHLFPIIVTRMIGVGEQSGKFEDTLFFLAEFYETEVDNATKSLSTIIEPVLLLCIGLVVGFLALSIITPIYDITGNIKR